MRGELDPDDSSGCWTLRIQYYTSSGADNGYQDVINQCAFDPVRDIQWKQVGGIFTPPANTTSIKFRLFSYMNSGWLAFDDVELHTAPMVTKYYYFNGQRIAMRKDGVLTYLHSDHLGSTSLTTDDDGYSMGSEQYRAYGLPRGGDGMPTDHRFTGQKEDASGLQYFNARFYDPAIGMFISPDTIVPEPGFAVSYNRYAYANLNPFKFVDPSGHFTQDEIESYLKANYKDHWQDYLAAWMSDTVFWGMLLVAQIGDTLYAPTSPSLNHGEFTYADNAAFGFYSHQGDELYQYQGYGPYRLTDTHGEDRLHVEKSFSTSILGYLFSSSPSWQQPLYRYQDGSAPQYSGYDRKVSYSYAGFGVDYMAGDSLPALPEMFVTTMGTVGVAVICSGCEAIAIAWGAAGTGTSLNNMFPIYHVLTVDLVDRRTWLSPAPQPCNAHACMSQDWSQHPDESDGLLK